MRLISGLIVAVGILALTGCPGGDGGLIGKWQVWDDTTYEFKWDGTCVVESVKTSSTTTREGTYFADGSVDPHQLTMTMKDGSTMRWIYRVSVEEEGAEPVLRLGAGSGESFPSFWGLLTTEIWNIPKV